MKIDVMISDRLLELGIARIAHRLTTIAHMIEITVLYSILV